MFRSRALALLLAIVTVGSFVDAFVPGGFNAASVASNRRMVQTSRATEVRLANRKARRMAEDKKKGKGKGASKPAKQASDAKWLQVLDSPPAIEPGSAKVVSGKYKGNDMFFTLTEYGGNYLAVGEACGRCKFPLINGKVQTMKEGANAEDVTEATEQDPEAKVVIGCPLCGAMYDLNTGVVAGEKPRGLAQQFVSKLVSQTVAERIKAYEARELSSGAIVIRVD